MKISVIVTCRNYGKYLRQCLDSISKQNFFDYEVILYDDASDEEKTKAYLDDLESRRHDIKIIRGSERLGLAAATNEAMKHARGKYIMRLDADDWLSERCLSIMSTALDNDDNLGAVFSDYWLHKDGERHYRTQGDEPPHGSCMLMRWDVVFQAGGYREDLEYQEDYDFWKRLEKNHRVEAIHLPLWNYRSHGGQMSVAHNARMKVRQTISEGPKILTVIPARGGSKGVKRKNLYKLNGVPLVSRAIQMVKESKIDSLVYVSTEDDEIAEIALSEGVGVIHRPDALAKDDISTISVARHAMTYADDFWQPDFIVSVQPTCPYTPPSALRKGVEILTKQDTIDSVVSIAEITGTHPYRAYWKEGLLLEPLIPDKAEKYLQRQDRPKFYGFTGGFYIRRRCLLESWSGEDFALGITSGVVVSEREALDIDNRMDIFLAETILSHWEDA